MIFFSLNVIQNTLITNFCYGCIFQECRSETQSQHFQLPPMSLWCNLRPLTFRSPSILAKMISPPAFLFTMVYHLHRLLLQQFLSKKRLSFRPLLEWESISHSSGLSAMMERGYRGRPIWSHLVRELRVYETVR